MSTLSLGWKGTVIARAMKRVVTILTQIGRQIITMILSTTARAMMYGNADFPIISPAMAAQVQTIRAG